MEDLNIIVECAWAPERVLEEIELIHPGYVLPESNLKEILKTAADSRDAYEAVWKEIAIEEKDTVVVLQTFVPLGTFVGAGESEILSLEDGLADGLTEQPPKQELNRLRPLMEAAAEAHMQLKESLAPNTAWAKDRMHDTLEVPYENERRRVVAPNGPFDWVPGALLIDLGLQPERHIFERAKYQQRPEQTMPPLSESRDISRIVIVCENCKDLCDAVEKLQERLEVVTLENGFLNPDVMGRRCIVLTVKYLVEVENKGLFGTETHIGKLVLEHKEMFAITEGVGAAHLNKVRSTLVQLGTPTRELNNLQRIVLNELGSTKFQVMQAQEDELNQALAYATDERVQAQKAGPELAQHIVDEAIEQALAAGVPEMRVIAATARAGLGEDQGG